MCLECQFYMNNGDLAMHLGYVKQGWLDQASLAKSTNMKESPAQLLSYRTSRVQST